MIPMSMRDINQLNGGERERIIFSSGMKRSNK